MTSTDSIRATSAVRSALRKLEAAGFELVVRETYRGSVEISFDNHAGNVFGTVRIGLRSGRFVSGNAHNAGAGFGQLRRVRCWQLTRLADVRALAA